MNLLLSSKCSSWIIWKILIGGYRVYIIYTLDQADIDKAMVPGRILFCHLNQHDQGIM